MSHPIIEIHFEDVQGVFENVTKNWYHLPREGEYIELAGEMMGRVISVGWVEGPRGEYVVVRVK